MAEIEFFAFTILPASSALLREWVPCSYLRPPPPPPPPGFIDCLSPGQKVDVRRDDGWWEATFRQAAVLRNGNGDGGDGDGDGGNGGEAVPNAFLVDAGGWERWVGASELRPRWRFLGSHVKGPRAFIVEGGAPKGSTPAKRKAGAVGPDGGGGGGGGTELFHAEAILGHRKGARGDEFLVKWKGYPASAATWEPLEHLDREMRALAKRGAELCNRSVRDRLARLTQLCTVLNLDREAELAELWGDGSGWRISGAVASDVARLRVDFREELILELAS